MINLKPMSENSKQAEQKNNESPGVTGIGGIFFYVENLKETAEWYKVNLGIEINQWGFISFSPEQNDHASVQWKPFNKESKHFEPSTKDFMINYTVRNLEALYHKLKENKVQILEEIESYDFGKFLHILDPEGNKIELWEPA